MMYLPTHSYPISTGYKGCASRYRIGMCRKVHDRTHLLSYPGYPLSVTFKKYNRFSVLIYSYINTSGKWKNEKLCGNTTPAGRSVFTQFRVFPILTSVDITVYQYGKSVLYFFYNIAQRTLTKEWREIFRVDIELYQHGS